mgnify:CR=1 FL=1
MFDHLWSWLVRLLIGASIATTATTMAPTTSAPYVATTIESHVAEAPALGRLMEFIDFDAEALLPGWTLSVTEDYPDRLGETDCRARTVSVGLRSGQSDAELAFTLAHEIGHAMDCELGARGWNLDWRPTWLVARGFPEGHAWWPQRGTDDRLVGCGDFAESFAVVVTGTPSTTTQRRTWRGEPDATQVLMIRQAIEAL